MQNKFHIQFCFVFICIMLAFTMPIFAQDYFQDNFSLTETYLAISRPEVVCNQSNNPAWQIRDYTDNNMSYGVSFDFDNGDFALPYIPSINRDVNYTAAGQKKLFENGLFTGYVSYHQQNMDDKKWVHNRLPYRGIPFLLADSSTGGMELNGIHWQLGYSHKLRGDKLYLGSSLFYNVDEEHKTIFPKPINKHRDIAFTTGLGSKLSSKINSGISITYFDFQEIMKTSKYSLEQDKTPIFFNIRGLDNPIISRGQTSEERQIDITGYRATFDSDIQDLLADEIKLMAGLEQAESEAVDGGAYPVPQGTWASDRYFYSVRAAFSVFKSTRLEMFSKGQLNHQTADHPDINVGIYEYHREQILAGIAWQFPVGRLFEIKPSVYGASQYLKREDKFNGILDYYPATIYGGSLKFQFFQYKGVLSSLEMGTSFLESGNTEMFTDRIGWYFNQITAPEAEYYQSNKIRPWASAEVRWNYNPNLDFLLKIQYGQIIPDSHYFENSRRSSLKVDFCVEY
ncbi:MAG: hypothetical protein K9N00_00345 [Candidatus Marinimicrobia bacterium]|nr:hypothetical protein [Candidatus Neomarinimicrobiota bacterium]